MLNRNVDSAENMMSIYYHFFMYDGRGNHCPRIVFLQRMRQEAYKKTADRTASAEASTATR